MEKIYSDMRQFDALKLRSNAIQKGVNTLNAALSIGVSVVEKWDGKDLSRRLTTAIQKEIDEKLGVDKVHVSMSYESYSSNEMTFYLCERSYQDAPNCNGYSCTNYIDNELHTRVSFDKSIKVESAKIVAGIQVRIQWNENVAYKYEDAVKNYKAYIERYKKAVEEFQTICGEINPLFVENNVSTYKGYYPKNSPWEENRDKALNR